MGGVSIIICTVPHFIVLKTWHLDLQNVTGTEFHSHRAD
jgi:hypothetical protein